MGNPENPELPLRQWGKKYPDLGTHPLPHEPNISPAYFEREREKLFKRSWLLLCREDEIPNPGSYAVKQVEILETSVLLVRGDDGVVRAFHNSCRHRGNKVVMGSGEKTGESEGFICGFHGFTYDLRGCLKSVVDEEDFYQLDKSRLSLKSINCETWRGFIFINRMDTPTETLEEALGDWAKNMEPFPFEDFELVDVYSSRVKCNWKIGLDAFQEGYHALTLHGKTAAGVFTPKDNPFSHLINVDLFPEGHRSASFPANSEFEPSPSVMLALKHAGNNIYAYEEAGEKRNLPGVNQSGAADWSFDINIVFPHVQLLASDAFYVTQHFWPVSVDETYWELRQYLPKSKTVSDRIAQQNSQAALRDVIREDMVTLENTQSVLRSGAISHMELNDSEILVRHSYQKVDERVNAPD
jgi:phenylpropionate dioxygenase-like ring-hydroxylating dioxygenase large terminal subunit